MSEKQIIRIIHILTGLLVFMLVSGAVFGAAYFGMSKLQAGKEDGSSFFGNNESGKTEEDQKNEIEEISSKGKMISVYNGAGINGLAGRWSKTLQEDGYRIEVIDNYDEKLEQGRIIVKEEGMGMDLQREYFPDIKIEVGTPDDDMDIQIILGVSEDDE